MKLTPAQLKAHIQHLMKTKPWIRIVGVWQNIVTGEEYVVTGRQGGASLSQVLKYCDFLLKKEQFVRNNQTKTVAFLKFIMEQNDGSDRRERGLGFAGHFPHGCESNVVFDFIEFGAHQSLEAKEIYRGFSKNFDSKFRIDVVCPEIKAASIRYLLPA